MTADPKAPKVGDVFISKVGDPDDVKTVTALGRKGLFYVDSDDEEWPVDLKHVAEVWLPVPEPLITEPVTLYRQGTTWHHGYDAHSRNFRDVPYITILPDGTWHEGPPS